MLSCARLPLLGAASTLLVALTLSAPALADQWHGHPGMGHPDCHAYHPIVPGHGGCPAMHSEQVAPAGAGKALGVMVSDLPNAILDETEMLFGINVERVQPESAAAAAGIRAGDVIAEFAGKPVFSADRLRWLVRKAPLGKGVDIKLMREGKPLVVTATLTEPAPMENCDATRPRHGS